MSLKLSFTHLIQIAILALFGFFLIEPVGGFFGAVGDLHVVAVLVPLWVLGAFAVLGAGFMCFSQTRIAGALIGVITAGIFALTSILSLFFTPIPHPASILFSLVVATAYLDSLSEAIHNKYN